MSKYPNWDKFWTWVTANAIRWNRMIYAGVLLAAFMAIIDRLTPVTVPPEVFWLTLGIIIGGWVQAMNAPDPSKSEVLALAEKVIDKIDAKN